MWAYDFLGQGAQQKRVTALLFRNKPELCAARCVHYGVSFLVWMYPCHKHEVQSERLFSFFLPLRQTGFAARHNMLGQP